jgi:hypothetical protein
MIGLQPFLSRIDEPLQNLILRRGGNTRPKTLDKFGVSGLQPWIRVTSAAFSETENINGLVMDSINPYSNFNIRYGTNSFPGILGYQLDLKTPVNIIGEGRGLRPSPLIQSLSAKNLMNGTVEATFDTVAFTTEQCEELSKFLLEPGFHLLIEWGWNTAASRSQIVGGGGPIDVCEIAKYNNWEYVLQKMKNSDYQYFATLGTILGGGVEFGEDRSFNIKTKIIGLGSYAEMLQIQNGVVDTESNDTSSDLNFEKSDIDSFGDDVGKILFAKMFNNLPPQKKTDTVKSLINDSRWTDPANFVNMDSDVVQEIKEGFSNYLSTITNTLGNETPTEVDFISNERFIRFELAIQILNSYGLNIEAKEGTCPQPTRSMKINIENSVISAFPHIFSTDPSKLFIPNTKHPNFNFLKAFSDPKNESEISKIIDFANLDSDENLSNNHPFTNKTKFSEKEELNGVSKDYESGESRAVPYAFPCKYKLDESTRELFPVLKYDESFLSITEDEYWWGWLKDLYVNFNFFYKTLDTPNLVAKDVFYNLLNGMTSAVNSIWHFEIIQDLDENGNAQMTVIDTNFRGKTNKTFEDYEVKFPLRGTDSPFIQSSFSTESSSQMVSSLAITKMNPNTAGADETPYTPKQLLGTAFSLREDRVGSAILSAVKMDESLNTTDTVNTETEDKANSVEERNPLFEIFTSNATIVPKLQNKRQRSDIISNIKKFSSEKDLSGLEKLLMVGAWANPNTLKKVELKDRLPGSSTNQTITDDLQVRNIPIGLEKVNFTIHGVSGLKINDRIRYSDIPSYNAKNRIYTITSINHTVNLDSWETSVESQSIPLPGDII